MTDAMVSPAADFVGFVPCDWCGNAGADTAVVTAAASFATHDTCVVALMSDRNLTEVEEV